MSLPAFAAATLAVLVLVALNVTGTRRMPAYVLAGCVLCLALVRAGIHGTVVGVAVGLAIPFRDDRGGAPGPSPLSRLENRIHPWVAFGVVPPFAFFNSGIELSAGTLRSLAEAPSLGIVLGLAVGKPAGILAGVSVAVTCGLAALPKGSSWRHLVGACLAGRVGFTMSLFMAALAFPDPGMFRNARLSVSVGSVLSGAAAVGFLVAFHPRAEPGDGPEANTVRSGS